MIIESEAPFVTFRHFLADVELIEMFAAVHSMQHTSSASELMLDDHVWMNRLRKYDETTKKNGMKSSEYGF